MPNFLAAMSKITLSFFGAILPDSLAELHQLLIAFTGEESTLFSRHEVTVIDQDKHIKSIIVGEKLTLIEKGRPETSNLGNYRTVTITDLKDDDLESAMSNLSLEFWFETFIKGYQYQADSITISIYQVYDLEEQFNIDSCKEYDPAFIVEATASQIVQERLVQVSKSLYELAGHLEGVVLLKPVDHGCLQQKQLVK